MQPNPVPVVEDPVAPTVVLGLELSPPAGAAGGGKFPRSRRRGPTGRRGRHTLRGIMRSVAARAVSAEDAQTRAHSRRVARYAAALAGELRVGGRAATEIRFAGLLHDAGKIGVPNAVLCKAGPLAEREWRRVRRHPVIGEHLLGPLLQSHPRILAAVRWHHERFDGSGFPDGLRGEEIPLEARIVAVVDAYDAMTTDRPYRRALSEQRAERELRRGSGTQFDPWCVAAFLRLLHRIRRWRVEQRDSRQRPAVDRCAPRQRRSSARDEVRVRNALVSGPAGGQAERGRRIRPRAPPRGECNARHPSTAQEDIVRAMYACGCIFTGADCETAVPGSPTEFCPIHEAHQLRIDSQRPEPAPRGRPCWSPGEEPARVGGLAESICAAGGSPREWR